MRTRKFAKFNSYHSELIVNRTIKSVIVTETDF